MTAKDEIIILLVEKSLLSFDVALLAKVTRFSGSIPFPNTFFGDGSFSFLFFL